MQITLLAFLEHPYQENGTSPSLFKYTVIKRIYDEFHVETHIKKQRFFTKILYRVICDNYIVYIRLLQ